MFLQTNDPQTKYARFVGLRLDLGGFCSGPFANPIFGASLAQ